MTRRRPSKRTLDSSKMVLEGDFLHLKNRLIFRSRFVSDFAPFWLPKCFPFGTLLASKIGQKINRKLDCSKCRPKIAPRPPSR